MILHKYRRKGDDDGNFFLNLGETFLYSDHGLVSPPLFETALVNCVIPTMEDERGEGIKLQQ